ncbi:MAG: hypothetical protein U1F70_03650, partial [Candidatus Competibacteraceae bacterium]
MSKTSFLSPAGPLLALLLGACAAAPSGQNAPEVPLPGGAPQLTAKPQPSPEPAKAGMDLAPAPKAPLIFPSTGDFIDKKAAAKP